MLSVTITFSIVLIFISWIFGMYITALVSKTAYYQNKLSNLNFIKNEKLNSIIGVQAIKWMVKNTFLKSFNQKLTINGKINVFGLKNLREEMTKSEIDHLFAFLFVMVFVLLKMWKHEYLYALIILIINFLTNLYPSLIQQQNKRRIDKLIENFEK